MPYLASCSPSIAGSTLIERIHDQWLRPQSSRSGISMIPRRAVQGIIASVETGTSGTTGTIAVVHHDSKHKDRGPHPH